MKRMLTFLATTCMAASAHGQINEFRYDGFADVIFSCPERGKGGRAFVHDANNLLTINYEGDFTKGVKIGNSFWISNNGMLNTLADAAIGTTAIENSEGWNRVFQVNGKTDAKSIVSTNFIQSGLWSHELGYYGALAGGMVGTRSNHPFSIITNQTAKVTILSNGNMGIGTSNPQAKLAVDGNILAKEIKIKTDVNVPDYVFEPDYNLKSLEEIESYIKANKHLPEVPSGKEIQADGLNVAAMNLLLLKKIEELTLHLIEKDKLINQVIGRLDKLEAKK